MANSSLLRRLILVVFAAALVLRVVNAGGDFSWTPVDNRVACQGLIAECMGGSGEFDMDSESNRRMLATSNYISYGALEADRVTCSEPGAPYYNCQPGAGANPYTRSCTAATQCRS